MLSCGTPRSGSSQRKAPSARHLQAQKAMNDHALLVANISATVKDFHARRVPFRIYHGSTNSTRKLDFSPNAIVDTSPLHGVLDLDPGRRIVLVEPNVRMDTLIQATLKHGLIPPVVPEFPAITVGGAFAGTAGESSSFKHGFFDAAVNWCEIVLGNGEVVCASAEENADLFEGSKGALGTLGVATLFELRLIPTEGWVELDYIPVWSAKDMMEKSKAFAECPEDYDFIDGIMFKKKIGLIILGTMTSVKKSREKAGTDVKKVMFRGITDQWFYLHAEQVMNSMISGRHGGKITRGDKPELVPLADYLFRYDRGGFWTAKYAFKTFHTPYNRVTRTLLDPLMKTERMYKALHHSGMSQKFLVQDVAIPSEALPGFLDWTSDTFKIFPLWICPLSPKTNAIFQTGEVKLEPDDFNYNVGIWGLSSHTNKDWFTRFVADNRLLEKKVGNLGGCKCLYAHMYYTEEEFWQLYDKPRYELLRSKWHAQNLPDVYSKVKPREKPGPVQPIRGVVRLLLGRNAILASTKEKKVSPISQQTSQKKSKASDDDSSTASHA